MRSNLLFFAVSFMAILFLLFSLKNIFYLTGSGLEAPHSKIFRKRIVKYIAGGGKFGRKITGFVIFAILAISLFLISKNFIFSIFSSGCLWIYIIDFLNGFEERRRNQLNNQIVEFLSYMAVMLKSGNTVRNIFKSSSGCFKNPLNDYLVDMAGELELNFTLDEALDRFSERCRSREVDLLVSSLKINDRIGGDLIPIIDSVADSIRYNLKLKSKMMTLSLQSRYSGNIISIFPVIILVLMCIFLNDAVMDFFSTMAGIVSLALGGTLEIAGIFITKKIIGVKEF